MTAYNIQSKLSKARRGDRTKVADPGDAGTIKAQNVDRAVCVVTGGTTRSLEAAARYSEGASILVISQTSSITVNSQALADGEHAEFIVTLDSNGAKQWVTSLSTNIQDELNTIETYLERAKTVHIPLSSLRVHDAFATNLPSTAGNDDLGLVLGTYGTNRTEVHYGDAATGTISRLAALLATVPQDYVAGEAMSIVIPFTRDNAAEVSATVDIEVWREAAPTVDINSTAAVDINAAASGTATFVLTPTNLVPGEQVKIRITGAADDTGGAASDHALLGLAWSYTPTVIS